MEEVDTLIASLPPGGDLDSVRFSCQNPAYNPQFRRL
jgi:hypothetical protein